MKQEISYKNFFINYAIFVVIAAAVFGILIYVIKISQKSWDKNLKAAVEYTLAESEPDTWEIGKSVRITNPLSAGAACYDARNKKSGETGKAIIIRIQTFYGPHCGVFIVQNDGKIDFKGYSSLHGRVAVQLKNSYTGRRVEYWSQRIVEMLKQGSAVMKQKKSFMYIASFLALTIPTPGRFVLGFTLVFELFILEVLGILVNSLVSKLKFNEIRTYFVMLFMISITLLYRQILVLTYTEIALNLGFLLYLPPVSVFLTHTLFTDFEEPLPVRLKTNLFSTLVFSLMILLFFLFRDIAGYGTFTFFGKNHRIFEKVILNPDKVGIFTFFASISGALVLTGLVIYLFMFIRNKARIISGRGE